MLRVVAIWGAGVVALGCGQNGRDAVESGAAAPLASAADSSDVGHRHALDVDWVPFSEAQIYESAAAVIRGHVVQQLHGFHRTYPFDPQKGRELTPDEAGDEYAELPLTTSIIRVDERFSDAQGDIEPRSTVKIVQLGGRYADGCWVEPNDQQLLQMSDEIVAFLKPAGMVPMDLADRRGAYAIVGGQQGLVPVRHGHLDPIPSTAFERYASRRVEDLARDIEGFAKAPAEGGE